MNEDAFVQDLRRQISATDRVIFDWINRRLRLVAILKRYKQDKGIPLVDPTREEAMVERMLADNVGPLSAEELVRVYRDLLALTKREVFENGIAPS